MIRKLLDIILGPVEEQVTVDRQPKTHPPHNQRPRKYDFRDSSEGAQVFDGEEWQVLPGVTHEDSMPVGQLPKFHLWYDKTANKRYLSNGYGWDCID